MALQELVFSSLLPRLLLGRVAPTSSTPLPPCPHQTNPRGFWVLSGDLQSPAAPVGDGESGEGHQKEIGRWQAGHTERGPSRRQGTSEPWPPSLGPSLVPKNLSGSRPVGRQATSGDLNGFANFPDS